MSVKVKAAKPKSAKPKSAKPKSAKPKATKPVEAGWSSEGRWVAKFATAKLKERAGQLIQSPSAQKFVKALPTDPLARATRVMQLIDSANAGKLAKGAGLDLKLALAWGSAVVDGLGWEPIETRDRAGRIHDGLADPERRWLINERDLMRRLLGLGGSATSDNTALLLYNMMAAQRLPPVRPGSYLTIG